jgi:hypothetical protein
MTMPVPPPPDEPADLPAFERSDGRRRRVVQGSVCLAFVASSTWTFIAWRRAGHGSVTVWQVAAVLAWVRGLQSATLEALSPLSRCLRHELTASPPPLVARASSCLSAPPSSCANGSS